MIKKTLGTMFAVTMIFLLILTVFTLFFGSYYFGVAGFLRFSALHTNRPGRSSGISFYLLASARCLKSRKKF